jgi:glycosyltransferase involved in cell wall biosynthesis
MENRAFFSIIIPCYNTKPDNMRMLLESIKNQNIADDIEVVIADDRSTQIDFYDVIEEYKNILNIKTTISSSEAAHCPGNTREAGASIATGEWITFVDHDDELIEDTYKKIKEEILKAGEQYVASCNFYEVDPYNGNILNEFCHVGN